MSVWCIMINDYVNGQNVIISFKRKKKKLLISRLAFLNFDIAINLFWQCIYCVT